MPRVHEMRRSGCTPTSGEWASLPPDVQELLSNIAANVKVLLARMRAEDAYDEMHSLDMEATEEVALWTRFDSSERAVLKAVAAARREKRDDRHSGI